MANNLRILNENMEKMADRSQEFHEVGKAWLNFYAAVSGSQPALPPTNQQEEGEEEEGD